MKNKKLTKMEELLNKFHYDDKDNIMLIYYGVYRMGLTQEEVKDYLRARANKSRIETIYKKFCVIVGVNRMSMYKCPCCEYNTSLMYRLDVLRFADQLFEGKPTYFD